MWFAVDIGTSTAVGTVTLGGRKTASGTRGQVQWLAVAPQFRRLGVARLLIAQLEWAALESGYHQLEAETLNSWSAANRFYQGNGWQRQTL